MIDEYCYNLPFWILYVQHGTAATRFWSIINSKTVIPVCTDHLRKRLRIGEFPIPTN